MIARPTIKMLLVLVCSMGLLGSGTLLSQDVPEAPDFELPEDIATDFGEEEFGAVELSPEEEAAAAAVAMGTIVMVIIGSIVGLVITALVAYLLMDALHAVPEPFRQISPIIPWLLFVPLVNIVVLFVVFIKVPESLKSYLDSSGQPTEGDCGKTLGLWGSVLYILGCTFPIGLVMLIISLMKIGQAKRLARDLSMNAAS